MGDEAQPLRQVHGDDGGAGALSARFEELARGETTMGVISLRRRLEPSLRVEVFEVKLGDEFLMSNLFTVAEIELAQLGLAGLPDVALDVVVGGLGYTARAVLRDPRVRSLVAVEALGEVIRWHEGDLLPDTRGLAPDPRIRLQPGGIFALWSDNPPDEDFQAVRAEVFDSTAAHVVTFPNPLTGGRSANTIYTATCEGRATGTAPGCGPTGRRLGQS